MTQQEPQRARAVRPSRGVAVVLAACAAGALLPGPADAVASDPLSASALFSDVQRYVELGPRHHLTGSREDERTQRWMRDELAAAGALAGTDAYSYFSFRPRRVGLSVAGRPYENVAPFFYSGTTGRQPRTAALVDVGLGSQAEVAAADVAGKIAVIDVPYFKGALDPTFAPAFARLEAAGAVGLVAVTGGPQDLPVNQDVDSREGAQHLPTLFIGKRSGREVIEAARAGATASLLLDAEAGRSCTTNTWAVLPGRDPERVIVIATPTGAFTPSGSERGPGVATLLGLARHWASLPQDERPATLVFAVLSGHEIGFLGLPTLMRAHPDWFATADAYVHLGASLAAIEQDELPDGTVLRSSAGDWTRALYVSENPLLEPGVTAAFAPAQPLGSLPPSVWDPGEQSLAYAEGLPIIASSGASHYFHTAGDTAEAVSPVLLETMTRAFADTVDSVAGLPAGAVRAANAAASTLGPIRGPSTTPGGGPPPESEEFAPRLVERCAGNAGAR